MVRKNQIAEDGSQPVMVPLNTEPLVPVEPERRQRLRDHLNAILQDLGKAKHLGRIASPVRPGPEGFQAVVARTACSLCKGWCCRNGADDAFLDDATLARVRLAKSATSDNAMLRLYLGRVPAVAYRNSCIFHGEQGCTLDRSMRADVCNAYYCGGLGAFMKNNEGHDSAVVLAGEGKKMRVSAKLDPHDPRASKTATRL